MDNGYQALRVTAAGTTPHRVGPIVVHTVTPDVSVGTIRIFDSATAAGTTATNLRATITGGTAIQDCFSRIYDVQLKNGLTVAAEGTPIALFTLNS